MGLAYPRGMERISIPALNKRVKTEADAYAFMEELRWGDRPVCPHCGSVRKHYFLTPKADEGRTTRRGKVSERRVWKCADCRRQFSVLTGTIFHGTKIPVKTWLFVIVEIVLIEERCCRPGDPTEVRADREDPPGTCSTVSAKP